MAQIRIKGARIAGVCTCVPSKRFDNLQDTVEFSQEDVRKVVGRAGVAAASIEVTPADVLGAGRIPRHSLRSVPLDSPLRYQLKGG